LDYKYDGSNSTYPLFLNALLYRMRRCYWDAPGNTNITKYGTAALPLALFDNITSISEATLTTANANRTDARAKQNAKALWECLSKVP